MTQKTTQSDLYRLYGLSAASQAVLTAATTAKSVSDIAAEAGLPRTSVAYSIKKLAHRGLVESIPHGKRKLWKTDATIFDPGSIGRRTAEIFKGVPEILQIFERLASMPKYSRLWAIQPDKSIRSALRKVDTDYWIRIDDEMKKRKYIVEGIVHEQSVDSIIQEIGAKKAQKIFDSFIGRLEDYAKIPDEFANVEAELYMFQGSAYVINWTKELAIGIHDADMVSLLIALFSCTKETGVRYSQNARMKTYKDALQRKRSKDTITPPNTLR